jgi:hypothetical protein
LARSVEAVEVNGYTIKPGAKLTRAHLTRTDLSRAKLKGANLDRAVADRNTIWPEGFDPKATEVIFY